MKLFLNEHILMSGEEWLPNTTDEISSNLEELLKTLNCFNYHVDIEVFYSGIGLKKLIANLTDLESYHDYALTNPIDQLRHILFSLPAKNWNDHPIQNNDYYYYYQLSAGAASINVKDNTLAEATEYKFLGNNVFLLNFASSDYNMNSPIHVNRSKITPPQVMNIIQINITCKKDEVIAYIIKNRTQRKFNWNKKHGENGNGIIPNKDEIVSPLECSKEEAMKLLPFAVGCKENDELYVLDKKVGKYMVFKNENTNENSYHPYHPINQDEVPEHVRKFIQQK